MVEMSFDQIMHDMRARQISDMAKSETRNTRSLDPGYRPIRKSADEAPDVGRAIMTVGMMKSLSRGASSKPSAVSSVNGDAARPTLESIRKSMMSSARPPAMGGIEGLRKSAEYDWKEYNSFISNSE